MDEGDDRSPRPPTAKLTAEAAREGRSLPDLILQVLEEFAAPQVPAAHSVLRLAQQVIKSVPAEAWADLPADLSINGITGARAGDSFSG